MEIRLQPDLSHCIETVARKECERIERQVLETGEASPEDMARLETLRTFLESTDFSRLRGEYEPLLVQGKRVKFLLRSKEGMVDYQMGVE